MTTFFAFYHLNYQTKQLTLLAGSSTQEGYNDGDFLFSRFTRPKELLLIDEGRKLIVADDYNNRLKVIDRETNTTYSLCVKEVEVTWMGT